MSALQEISPLIAGSRWEDGGGWWFPFALFWIAVLGTAIWLVVRGVSRGERSGVERARDILAERYARGEITGEEYRDRLDELSRHR
jgi:putative membrane protein